METTNKTATPHVSSPVRKGLRKRAPDKAYAESFYTKPLETWTFVELEEALGAQVTSELLNTSRDNVRMLRFRNTTTIERMRILQNAVREKEQFYRDTLVTIYSTRAFRRADPHKDNI